MAVQSEGLGRIIARDDVSLKARSSEAPGASGGTTTHSAVELGDKAMVFLQLEVYAAPTGTTPTLLAEIEGSNDNTNWVRLGKIGSGTPGYAVANGSDPTVINAVGTYRGVFPATRYIRSKGVIGGTGTPTFDYSIGGNAS